VAKRGQKKQTIETLRSRMYFARLPTNHNLLHSGRCCSGQTQQGNPPPLSLSATPVCVIVWKPVRYHADATPPAPIPSSSDTAPVERTSAWNSASTLDRCERMIWLSAFHWIR
jgi:hypothetical protein